MKLSKYEKLVEVDRATIDAARKNWRAYGNANLWNMYDIFDCLYGTTKSAKVLPHVAKKLQLFANPHYRALVEARKAVLKHKRDRLKQHPWK